MADADLGEGGMPCSDVAGAWSVSNILASSGCGTAAEGNAATISAGAAVCQFTVASVSTDMPAMDGTLTLDAGDDVVAAETSLGVGGEAPVSCSGSLTGDTLTFTCGSCVIQLGR
jgi:hypothetical protein